MMNSLSRLVPRCVSLSCGGEHALARLRSPPHHVKSCGRVLHKFETHASFLPAPAQQIAETVTLAVVLGGIALSSLPLLTGEAKKRNAQRPVNEETDEDNFVWTVMGFISFLPCADWTAWAFKAVNDDDPAYYYGLAFLYGLPWVLHDLRLDGYTILSLLLCAAHVQIERTAATEQVQVDIPVGSQLAAKLQELLSSAARPAQEVVKSAQRKQLNAREYQRPPEQESQEQEEADYVEEELRQWDKRFKQRSKENTQERD